MEEHKGYSSSTHEDSESLHTDRGAPHPDVPHDVFYTDEEKFYMDHLNDPNIDWKTYKSEASLAAISLRKNHWDTESTAYSTTESRYTAGFEEESPYPEVRAAVANTDDPDMPVNTFRMWFLGLIFVIIITFFNQIFAMRYPSVYVTGIVVQLIALPIGQAWAKYLPNCRVNLGPLSFLLNPGPFSIKEHVCITVMANAVSGGIYIAEVSVAQRIFYGMKVPYSFQILIALGSQTFGYCLGGLLRRFVVYPSSMIWPGALVNSALFATLHKVVIPEIKIAGHISRTRFFLIAMAASFVWYWIPGYLFTGLSMFSWICWIVPNNVTVNALFGVNSGLGMSVLTFDWSMIAFINSPLVTPWWSEMNVAIAFMLMFWVVCPILYFTNVWDSAFLPITSYFSYDNTGMPYSINDVLTDGIFDQAKYEAYSPVILPVSLALAYGIAFAAFPAVFTHTFLWFRKDILRRCRSAREADHDIHMKLMSRNYSEIPDWWFVVVGIAAFICLTIALAVNTASQLPVWGAVLACAIGGCLSLPLAMLQAITNQSIPTQVMAELIIGYILPGKPMANMVFKSLMFSASFQAVQISGDFKLGHYMKIPPRVMFSLQMVAAVVSCFLVTGMQTWMLDNIPDVCTRQQASGFICPGSSTFFTASVIWGGIGPAKIFNIGETYSGLLWFFPIGFVLPIPFYFLARRYPLSFWRYINIPIFFAGLGAMPPANGINYISYALVGFIFNFVIRKLYFRWWMRYNYVLSAALDAGVAVAMIVVFFTLYLPKGGIVFDWWGNNVWMNTADAMGIPFKTIAEGATIGPATWS